MATIQQLIDKLKMNNQSNSDEREQAIHDRDQAIKYIEQIDSEIRENERTIVQLESTKPSCVCKNHNGPPPPCGVDESPTFGLWHPIETAPKGATILISNKSWISPSVGYFSIVSQKWEFCGVAFKTIPTHWMPLPPTIET